MATSFLSLRRVTPPKIDGPTGSSFFIWCGKNLVYHFYYIIYKESRQGLFSGLGDQSVYYLRSRNFCVWAQGLSFHLILGFTKNLRIDRRSRVLGVWPRGPDLSSKFRNLGRMRPQTPFVENLRIHGRPIFSASRKPKHILAGLSRGQSVNGRFCR